uniref:Copper transport protein n=1 Tax=Acrobeloides nanus TaxID=290746 RepID=A0A914EMR1_9BILA
MMWMWFHTSIDDTVLFDFWTVKTVGGMIHSCVLVFLMGLCFEGIKFLRWRVEVSKSLRPTTSKTMRYVDKFRSLHHLIQTFLYGIQIVVGYLLMLVFMTFSIWLSLSVTLGAAFGYYLFGYIFSCIAVALIAMVHESIRYARAVAFKHAKENQPCCAADIVRGNGNTTGAHRPAPGADPPKYDYGMNNMQAKHSIFHNSPRISSIAITFCKQQCTLSNCIFHIAL